MFFEEWDDPLISGFRLLPTAAQQLNLLFASDERRLASAQRLEPTAGPALASSATWRRRAPTLLTHAEYANLPARVSNLTNPLRLYDPYISPIIASPRAPGSSY